MNESDVLKIETALGAKVPSDLRQLLSDRLDELRAAGCFSDGILSPLFLSARAIIDANLAERSTDTATFFPNWWETFFLTGTNGAGDFYCLRLDGDDGLWMIGSDCGAEPTRVAESLVAFVEERLQSSRELDAAEATRRSWIGAEEDAERKSLARHPNERALEWFICRSSWPMNIWLQELGYQWSERKHGLFRAACVKRNCSATDYEIMGDLLRETLGNPYFPVEFQDEWRTPAVVELALSIEATEDFGRLPELAAALADAGCENERLLAHCRREGGHVPGCWALDGLLQNEPAPTEELLTWGYTWPHPTIPVGEIESRFLAMGAGEVSADDAMRFADWLAERGDAAWAEYIRVRCRLDRQPPDADYADLVERRFEVGAAMRASRAEFDGFYFGGYRFAGYEWWDDETDDIERGLPAMVDAVPAFDGARPLAMLLPQIEAMVERTPVRGLDFAEHYADRMSEILESSGGSRIRRLSFRQMGSEGSGKVLAALRQASVASQIEWLKLWTMASDRDCSLLAGTPFRSLERFDCSMHTPNCTPSGMRELLEAPWFTDLRQLRIGFNEEGPRREWPAIPAMPRLHSLTLESPVPSQLASISPERQPSLRRLRVYGGLEVAFDTAPLVDLSLDRVTLKNAESLFSSPTLAGLQALSLHGPFANAEVVAAVAASPFAAGLRILRIDCGNSGCVGTLESLADSGLARSDAFPHLTTLEIRHPYKKGVMRDTANFLQRLDAPRLRHLELHSVDFDDACAAALMQQPAYAGLRRLHVHQDYGEAEEFLSPAVAKRWLRCDNLRGLVELELHNLSIGDAVESLFDRDVLPNLASASLYGTGGTRHRPQMKTLRPEVHLG